eukprot:7380606-Prymnesium_polylepis.4
MSASYSTTDDEMPPFWRIALHNASIAFDGTPISSSSVSGSAARLSSSALSTSSCSRVLLYESRRSGKYARNSSPSRLRAMFSSRLVRIR